MPVLPIEVNLLNFDFDRLWQIGINAMFRYVWVHGLIKLLAKIVKLFLHKYIQTVRWL